MDNFNVNINVDDILTQREEENVNLRVNTFNVKNYLQARLSDKEDAKEITIRLLPFSPNGGSPFYKIFMHQVKVNKDVSPSGWKRFPCPQKNHVDGNCPFCETAELARTLKKNAVSDVDKKRYDEVEKSSYARPMWLVRCIERNHEEDGVKYWLFSDSKQKDGIYDKIHAIFRKRLEKGKNIFDLNSGKDLCLSLTKDSNGITRIAITDEDEWTPLTTDYDLGVSWINDPKVWTDVYKVKPYDYLSIILKGGVPVYNKELQKFVDRDEMKNQTEEQHHMQDDIPAHEVVQVENIQNKMSSYDDEDDDDLPF